MKMAHHFIPVIPFVFIFGKIPSGTYETNHQEGIKYGLNHI